MIRHVVMWTLKEQAEGADRATNGARVKERLESLRGRIPGMSRIEVGIDIGRTDASGDLVLVSDHDDRAALEAYQRHPDHVAMKAFIAAVTMQRRVVDYEVGHG
jgi:hypothetical protein